MQAVVWSDATVGANQNAIEVSSLRVVVLRAMSLGLIIASSDLVMGLCQHDGILPLYA